MKISINKTIKIIMTVAIIILVISGSTFGYMYFKQVQKEQKLALAQTYYNDSKYNDAKEIYKQVFEETNDIEVKKKMDICEYDINTIKELNRIKESWEKIIEEKLRSGLTLSIIDLKYVVSDLNESVQKIEKIDISKLGEKTSDAVYKIKKSTEYTDMKRDIEWYLKFDAKRAKDEESLGKLYTLLGNESFSILTNSQNAEKRLKYQKNLEGIVSTMNGLILEAK